MDTTTYVWLLLHQGFLPASRRRTYTAAPITNHKSHITDGTKRKGECLQIHVDIRGPFDDRTEAAFVVLRTVRSESSHLPVARRP